MSVDGSAALCPTEIPAAECVAVAKRDLKAGEALDGLGGFTVRGAIEKASVAKAEQLVPVGLTENARVLRAVCAGAALTMADVDLDSESLLVQLRREQDA